MKILGFLFGNHTESRKEKMFPIKNWSGGNQKKPLEMIFKPSKGPLTAGREN